MGIELAPGTEPRGSTPEFIRFLMLLDVRRSRRVWAERGRDLRVTAALPTVTAGRADHAVQRYARDAYPWTAWAACRQIPCGFRRVPRLRGPRQVGGACR